MASPLIIGIHGLAGSGKSQLADYLDERMPLSNPLVYVHFADPLKNAVPELMVGKWEESAWSDELHDRLHGSSSEREVPLSYGRCGQLSIRKVLQVLGHLGRAYLHEDIWVETAHRAINDLAELHAQQSAPGSMVVLMPDVRYENEARYILHERGGFVIQMREPVDYTPADNHPSEYGLTDYLHREKELNSGAAGARILYANSARLLKCLDRLKDTANVIWKHILAYSDAERPDLTLIRVKEPA